MVLIAAYLNADNYDSDGDRTVLGIVFPFPSSWVEVRLRFNYALCVLTTCYTAWCSVHVTPPVVNYMLHRLVFSTCNTSCC